MIKNITVFAKTIGLFTLLITLSIHAQQTSVPKPASSPMPAEYSVQANDDGVAIDGFDPVAYFDEGRAIKGIEVHTCEYLNKTWHFSSAENRDKFLSNPEKFSPQYGGFCAHSLGKNKIIESNPEAFAIRDDKLYLYRNNDLARKDAKKDEIKFNFNKIERDKNWLTFQRNF